MKKLAWAFQILVALMFAASGGMKLGKPAAELRANPQMAWANDFSDNDIKAIGAAELAGAIGLVAPAATGILPILSPIAGVGLSAVMGGAVATHVRRGESPAAPAILGFLALSVAYLSWRRQRRATPALAHAHAS